MCEWNIVVVIEIVCSFIIILFLLFSLNVCDPTEWLVVVDLNSIQYVYISLHWTVWVSEQSVARTQRMLQIFLFFSSFYFYFFCRLNCFYVLFCFLCMSVWAEHVYIQNIISILHSFSVGSRCVASIYYTKVCVRSYSAKVRPYRKSPPDVCLHLYYIHFECSS